jgi:hypothetical protein
MEAILPGFEEERLGFKGPTEGDGVGAGTAARRQGGSELWAKIDAIEVSEALDYPEQPIIRELDFGS